MDYQITNRNVSHLPCLLSINDLGVYLAAKINQHLAFRLLVLEEVQKLSGEALFEEAVGKVKMVQADNFNWSSSQCQSWPYGVCEEHGLMLTRILEFFEVLNGGSVCVWRAVSQC